eukprot:comp9349_c0_seq1/m.10771 comp9349_c0_seq1/g.10771  ORF comp9349_c0_seq1/g.10771 comp9349_c0_seq1/m.10771 type:complete len:259 (-) comp9349_c0_seq1:99-875(-)
MSGYFSRSAFDTSNADLTHLVASSRAALHDKMIRRNISERYHISDFPGAGTPNPYHHYSNNDRPLSPRRGPPPPPQSLSALQRQPPHGYGYDPARRQHSPSSALFDSYDAPRLQRGYERDFDRSDIHRIEAMEQLSFLEEQRRALAARIPSPGRGRFRNPVEQSFAGRFRNRTLSPPRNRGAPSLSPRMGGFQRREFSPRALSPRPQRHFQRVDAPALLPAADWDQKDRVRRNSLRLRQISDHAAINNPYLGYGRFLQ